MTRIQVWISSKKNGGWRVHKPEDQKDLLHLKTKEEAFARAVEIAKNHNAVLAVQKKNGTISSRKAYARDPFPPRG